VGLAHPSDAAVAKHLRRPRREDSPCYACLFPPTDAVEEVHCATMGVFAPLTGIVGTMQAAQALKIAGGFGQPLVGKLLLIDARSLQISEMRLPRNPECPVCGKAALRSAEDR